MPKHYQCRLYYLFIIIFLFIQHSLATTNGKDLSQDCHNLEKLLMVYKNSISKVVIEYPDSSEKILSPLDLKDINRLCSITASDIRVVFNNQTSEIFSDGKDLSYEERLSNVDLASILSQPYPIGEVDLPIKELNYDPGRLRNETLFMAVYGATEKEVESHLEYINFLGTSVRFNKNNNAYDALKRVINDIKNNTNLYKTLTTVTNDKNYIISTYNWRPIANTQRLSAHSFGIAIDINNDAGKRYRYWQWVKNYEKPEILQKINKDSIDLLPWELVKIFEKHSFIWGGKWNHFDMMHFEYRPEFFIKN